MADHELLVLSRPPAGVSDAQYNDWYDIHVREILALPAFVSARRLELDFVSATSEPSERYTFLRPASVQPPPSGAAVATDGWRLRTDVMPTTVTSSPTNTITTAVPTTSEIGPTMMIGRKLASRRAC